MNKKLLILTSSNIVGFLLFMCLISSCQKFINKEYNTTINTIKSIKHKNSYGSIDLTMEKYVAKDNEIIASFIYKNKKASVRLNFQPSKNRLVFMNIGSESDYFLYAISELFEEEIIMQKMKEEVAVSISRKGDNPKIDLFNRENEYQLFYKPNTTKKGSVTIRMILDMELGKIRLREKNGGIAKKNFVKAFEKQI